MTKLHMRKTMVLAMFAASSAALPAQAASSDIQARLVVRDECVLAQKKFAKEARPTGQKEVAFVVRFLPR